MKKKQKHSNPFTSRNASSWPFCDLRQLLIIAVSVTLGYYFGSAGNNDESAIMDLTTISQHKQPNNAIPASGNDDGWNTIDIFYGSSTKYKDAIQKDQKWFSQVHQDETVIALLSSSGHSHTNGFFIDLAANDAIHLSNTFALEHSYNWKGLCIEPNPKYWYELSHYRPNCQIVSAVIGLQTMEQIEFVYKDEYGGIINNQFDNHRKKRPNDIVKKKEYTVSLIDILERYNVPKVIDYMSLDVEGAEEYIMKGFPLDTYTIKLLTVERIKDGMKEQLEQHGYKHLCQLSDWGEGLWAHSSFMNQLDLKRLDEFCVPEEKLKNVDLAKAAAYGH